MTESTVLYDVSGAVATVTLNRPDAMNSFNGTMRQELGDALGEARGDSAVRAVVLTGAGRCFSAGADLKAGWASGADVERQLKEEYGVSLKHIVEMDKPVIAATNGFAAGIGLSYALAADLHVMGVKSFLLSPFSNIALIPDGGATWLLPRDIGYRRAFQIAVENERLPADRCLELGLANRVVPDGEVVSEAQAWAAQLAERAPLALARTKEAMRKAASEDYADTLENEARLQALCIDSEDCKEGISAFLEKRKADFKGR